MLFRSVFSLVIATFISLVLGISSAQAANSVDNSILEQKILNTGVKVMDSDVLKLPIEKMSENSSVKMFWSKSSYCSAAWGTSPVCKARYGTWGSPGLKINYKWGLRWFSNGEAAVSGRGYNAKGQERWYGLQGGQHGSGKVPWGNVLSVKAVKVKPMRFGVGSSIWWQ
mgnify:CR=1 FL=1